MGSEGFAYGFVVFFTASGGAYPNLFKETMIFFFVLV